MTAGQRLLVRAALAVVLLAVVSHTRADPDLWGHVRFGQDILSARSIPRTDSYSFTADRPWINHEWLAECVMSVAYLAGGGPGLAALKMLVVFATIAFVWSSLRRQRVDAASRDLLLALAIVGAFPQVNHVRPQMFSVVAFAALLWLLVTGGTGRRVLLIPVLFAAWVNLHGGWIVGGGVLALWALLSLFQLRRGASLDAPEPGGSAHGSKDPPLREVGREVVLLLVAGALALVATLANPYGWRMWQFLSTTVGFGRAEITDWQPLYRLGPGYVTLWVALGVVATIGAVHAWRARETDLRRVVVVVMLGLASFQVSRLLAFFAIAVVMLLGRDVALALAAWRQAPSPSAAARPPTRVATAMAILIAVALIAGGAVTSARNLSCVRMESDQAEPEIVALVTQRQLQGRLAVWFDWGEYAIWYFAPSLQVSIDGRRETVYGDRVMQQHLEFYYVPSSRTSFLTETRADYIWLPADLPVVSSLLADGWQPLYHGLRSVWLSRTTSTDVASAVDRQTSAVSVRCFPGP